MTYSAFGVDHGDVSKAFRVAGMLPTAARNVGQLAQGAKKGFSVTRGEIKTAQKQAGVQRGFKGMKQGFQAGMRGQGQTLRNQNRAARQVGMARAQRRLAGQPTSVGQQLSENIRLSTSGFSAPRVNTNKYRLR